MSLKIFIIPRNLILNQSDTNFCVICLEIEFLSSRSQNTRVFLIVIIDIFLKDPLTRRSSQIPWESLPISNNSEFLFSVKAFILFVEEISVPSLAPQHSEVKQQLEDDEFWHNTPSGSRSDIRPIVVMNMLSPFVFQSLKINEGLCCGLRTNVIGYKESSTSSFDSEVSFSPSSFEDPMVWVKSELTYSYVYLAICSKKLHLLS